MRWALGLQGEQDGMTTAYMELRGTDPGGSPGLNLQEGRAGATLFNTVYPQCSDKIQRQVNNTQMQGLMLTVLFSHLSPSIIFEMDLVGVFNREVGQLAPRHTAAG